MCETHGHFTVAAEWNWLATFDLEHHFDFGCLLQNKDDYLIFIKLLQNTIFFLFSCCLYTVNSSCLPWRTHPSFIHLWCSSSDWKACWIFVKFGISCLQQVLEQAWVSWNLVKWQSHFTWDCDCVMPLIHWVSWRLAQWALYILLRGISEWVLVLSKLIDLIEIWYRKFAHDAVVHLPSQVSYYYSTQSTGPSTVQCQQSFVSSCHFHLQIFPTIWTTSSDCSPLAPFWC